MSRARWLVLVALWGCNVPYMYPLHDRIQAGDEQGARKVLDDALTDPKLAADRRGLALLERAALRVGNAPAKAVLADIAAGDRLLETADLTAAATSKKMKNPRSMRQYERNGAIRYVGKKLVLKPHERLYENVLGMAAAFAAGDRSAMRVEARRLALTRTDLHSYALSARAYDLMGIGGLLASYAFESHDRNEACLFATEAARISKANVVAAQVSATCSSTETTSETEDTDKFMHSTHTTAKVRGVVLAGLAPALSTSVTTRPFSVTERPAPPDPEVSVDGARVNVDRLVDFAPIAFDFWQKALCMGQGQDAWQTLPGRIFAFEHALEPGTHTVRVKVGARERTHRIVVTNADIGLLDSFLFEHGQEGAPLRRLSVMVKDEARLCEETTVNAAPSL